MCAQVTTCPTPFTHPHVQFQKHVGDMHVHMHGIHYMHMSCKCLNASKCTVRILAKTSMSGECKPELRVPLIVSASALGGALCLLDNHFSPSLSPLSCRFPTNYTNLCACALNGCKNCCASHISAGITRY